MTEEFFRRLAAPAAFMSLYCLTATAAEAGQLVLSNGDRITGAISKIWDGEIYIEPDYADEFTVDMSAIASIESDQEFEIELADGTEIVAGLKGADPEGNQIVLVDGREEAMPLANLTELEEIEEYKEWDSYAQFDATVNKGNTDSENYRLSTGTNLKLGDHRHIADLLITREEQDGVSTKEQDLLTYNYNWLFDDPWFASFLASYEKDPIRDLDYRWIVGPGIGRDIWNDAGRLWNIQIGAAYQKEKIGGDSDNSAIAFWIMNFEHDLFDGDMEFFHRDRINTNISGRTNTVLKTTTGFRWEFTDDLYANISLDYDYETDPAEGSEKDDLTLVVGAGIEF